MIEIGKYTISSRYEVDIDKIIYNISINDKDPKSLGEGMDMSEDTFCKLIDEFYQETF